MIYLTANVLWFSEYGDEDDGSVNNILDAFGGAERSASISGLSVHDGHHKPHPPPVPLSPDHPSSSWTVLDVGVPSAVLGLPSPQHASTPSGVYLGTNSSPGVIPTGPGIRTGIATMRELSLVGGKSQHNTGTLGSTGTTGDAESSGVGSSASGGAHSTNSSAASPAGSSLSQSQQQQNEDYEHVYCQLDPYFVRENSF